jgi:hypothetical protein
MEMAIEYIYMFMIEFHVKCLGYIYVLSLSELIILNGHLLALA